MLWLLATLVILLLNSSRSNSSSSNRRHLRSLEQELFLPLVDAGITHKDQHRGIFPNFITQQEVAQLLALFEDKEQLLYTVHEGLYILHGMELVNFVDRGLNIKANKERVAVLSDVRDRIYRMAHSFFKHDMRIESVIINLRTLPGVHWTWNHTDWTHGVHIDNCAFDYGYAPDRHEVFSNATCTYNPCCARRQFTAILYFDECEGGELVFVDPDEQEEEQRGGGYAKTTIVPPAPGKLVLFTSGPENVHGVTRLKSNKKRYVCVGVCVDTFLA